MSLIPNEPHPFLDDLTADAELTSAVLGGPLIGQKQIKLAIDAVGKFYASQTPIFRQETDTNVMLEYDAVLINGKKLSAVVVADRNADGSVPKISVQIRPLGAALSIVTHLRETLSGKLPKELFV